VSIRRHRRGISVSGGTVEEDVAIREAAIREA
jgi:hypothetical protein